MLKTYLDYISTKAFIRDFRHILLWISFKLFKENPILGDLPEDLFITILHTQPSFQSHLFIDDILGALTLNSQPHHYTFNYNSSQCQ